MPMSARGGLLSGWVACRQLLRQPFTSNKFGIDEVISILLFCLHKLFVVLHTD